MIDQFLIFTLTGTVLFKYAPRKISESIVNALISEVFISDNSQGLGDGDVDVETYTTNGYTLKFKRENNPSFVVVAIYSSATPLKYSENLVRISATLFKELLGEGILENINNEYFFLEGLQQEEGKFKKYFELKLNEFENQVEDVIEAKKEPEIKKQVQASGKKNRKWGADGAVEEEVEGSTLDFSSGDTADNLKSQNIQIDADGFGSKDSKTGNFLVKDLNEEINELLNNSKTKQEVKEPFGFLKKFTGGKTITSEDIQSTLNELQNQLIKKNVAPEVAKHLTSNVEKELVGSKTKNWTSITTTAKEALAKSLTKILTPGTSVNLLEDIKKNQKPYVISVVGVNGVGKSTNLSKLAFWLLQNNFKVLIVACDTFRSGAVEQLRVHVNNLKNSRQNKDQIELFEGGYGGSDLVAKIAKNAIEYAKKNEFDIILMDTAGRRHNDAKLMAPLSSFAKAANPNKIIMVGEALVGTDSVAQAKNFNNAFGAGRTLDFFIISKCDTVGDLIGTMVNMVYATNIPILFVGVGQTYTDLRTLSVEWAVNILMS